MSGATICDIAKIVGVSPATISLALRDSHEVSQKTKLKVRAIAKELNYSPNSIARALVTNKTFSLGIVVQEMEMPFLMKIYRGMQDAAFKENYSVICNSTGRYYGDEKDSNIRTFLDKKVDGIILLPIPDDVEDVRYLVKLKVPVVLFGSYIPGEQVDCVINDNENSACEAIKYLIGLGHRRIAYIGYIQSDTTGRERFNGYRKALMDSGIPYRDEYVTLTTDIDMKISNIILKILALKERPTAIFLWADTDAMKTIKILKGKGIRVPEDISIIGCDNISFTELCEPPLTTIDICGYEIGKQAAELLLNRINNKIDKKVQNVIVKSKLVIRESCAAAHSD